MALANAILTHFFSFIYCWGKALKFKSRSRTADLCILNTPKSTCEKDRALAGGKPPAPYPHTDMLYICPLCVNMICYKSYVAEREQETTGRSGVLVGRWRSNPQVVCSRLDSALPFSYVDVGDAFQFINHISAVCLQPGHL